VTQRKDRIRVHIDGKEFGIVGGTFQEMLAAVKQINGRRFVSELKVWQLPGPVEDIQRQLDIGGYYLEGGITVSAPPASTQSPPTPAGGDRIRVLIGGHRLAIIGGNFHEMLAAVKELPGRRFDAEAKVWEIPGDLGVIKGMIEAAGFQLEGAADIPLTPVAPMETPDVLVQGTPSAPPPFEYPDFSGAAEEHPFEPPDWLDDAPFEDDYFPEEPSFLEEELPPTESQFSEPSFVSPPSRGAGPATGGDRVRIRWGDMPLVVTGGSFQEILAVVKTIPGRRFDSAEKVWQIPEDVTLDSVQQVVKAAGLVVMPEE
jgi:hypothetical protein